MTLTTFPAYPIANRPVRLDLVPPTGANYLKVFVDDALILDAELDARPKFWTPTEGKDYELKVVWSYRGAGVGGGWAASGYAVTEEHISTETFTIPVARRMRHKIGWGKCQAYLVLYAWSDAIRPTTLAEHGEQTPCLEDLSGPEAERVSDLVQADVQNVLNVPDIADYGHLDLEDSGLGYKKIVYPYIPLRTALDPTRLLNAYIVDGGWYGAWEYPVLVLVNDLQRAMQSHFNVTSAAHNNVQNVAYATRINTEPLLTGDLATEGMQALAVGQLQAAWNTHVQTSLVSTDSKNYPISGSYHRGVRPRHMSESPKPTDLAAAFTTCMELIWCVLQHGYLDAGSAHVTGNGFTGTLQHLMTTTTGFTGLLNLHYKWVLHMKMAVEDAQTDINAPSVLSSLGGFE